MSGPRRPRTLWQVLLAGVAVEPLLGQLAEFSEEELGMFHQEARDILDQLATPAGQVDDAIVERWAQTARTLALASIPTMGEAAKRDREAVERAYARVGTATRPRMIAPVGVPATRGGLRLVGRVGVPGR